MSDKDFVTKFLTLATINKPALGPDFQKPLSEVKTLGVALPPLKYKYDPKRTHGAAGNAAVNVTLKSVRAPKFSVASSFQPDETVRQMKQFLVEHEETLQQVEQLKLLLKGKVLHDSTLVRDLKAEDNSVINVMVSKPTVVEQTATPDEAPEPAELPVDANKTVEIPWDKIESVLQSTFASPEDAASSLQRLKRGWELA
ncbi:Mdy2p KNAG_0A01470 [Huiozyma naganishii CBS 8797]|uniref:Ubiquitin-like domain-containing protein n=1 Tax=Huiozyma naganishii (strain ATCC MYA-139 / BCRC 22969 / CBS 8797 / KCTC 17520 / NBRC 10181 / NCYC 3082 / Yp74L-3) TaxID=1071383 RepID=J7S375_HUIN7|nr:hypothetical protein KNAG_0A01470 [Kazachstania naganishii CBS 8797]CCK67836.1 hypothetical protein KNAG_0A01470 [Kazachstania naganishii CBS 8797]